MLDQLAKNFLKDSAADNHTYFKNLADAVALFVEYPPLCEPWNFYHFLHAQCVCGSRKGRELLTRASQTKDPKETTKRMLQEYEVGPEKLNRYERCARVVNSLLFFHIFCDGIDHLIAEYTQEITQQMERTGPPTGDTQQWLRERYKRNIAKESIPHCERFVTAVICSKDVRLRSKGSLAEITAAAAYISAEIIAYYAPILVLKKRQGIHMPLNFSSYLLQAREHLREELREPLSG